MSKLFIFLGMLQLFGFFRVINLENSPYEFGNGTLYKIISPLGAFIGNLISRNDDENKIGYIIGLIFTIIIVILFFVNKSIVI